MTLLVPPPISDKPKAQIVVNMNSEDEFQGIMLNGVDITKDIAGFSYSFKFGLPEDGGSSFAMVFDRLVRTGDEDAIPMRDDTGFCIFRQIFVNPHIKVFVDGRPKKDLSLPSQHKQN